MSVDWKRVAADRLTAIRLRDKRLLEVGERVEEAVKRAMGSRIHAGCLLSLSDPRTLQLIADVASDVRASLHIDRKDPANV